MNKHQCQERLWCFRRWSRKPWSAFASLSRLKIGVLSVSMSIILLATPFAGAQTVGTDTLSRFRTLHLDTVQVTARQTAVTVLQTVSQPRFLVDRKGSAPLGTAEQLLRLLPSVDIRERGGKSTQADISIRGGSFDGTMVMLNGIDFSDARTGHQSHSLPVDIDLLSDIALVDVVAHPGALAGAVDFCTAPLYPRYLRARLEGGTWGYGYGNLSGAFEAGGLKVLGAVSYRRSDGYRHNTDFRNVNAYARVMYDSPRAGSFDIQGGFQRRDWGSNGFYSLRFPDQFESTMTGLASARWIKKWGGLTLGATGSFRRNDDRFEMVRGDPSGIPFNYHTTYNVAASLSAGYDWPRAGTTSLGANYTRHLIYSTALGDRKRGIVGAWAGHRKSWNRLWTSGTTALNHTPYGIEGTFAAEAGWLVNRTFALKGTATRSMRLPTFTDLFYNVATYHPDPNLRPERAITYHLTAEAGRNFRQGKSWGVSASVWYRRTRNVIDWEQHGDGDWYSTQLGRLGTAGAELTAHYSSGGWLRTAMLSYGYTHSEMNVPTDYISKYALDYMRHKASAVVGVGFLRRFTLTVTGSFYDRSGSYIAAAGTLESYRPYFLLDGRLAWERKTLQLYLDVTNITSTRYFDFGGLPMPRAWASAGIVITIK